MTRKNGHSGRVGASTTQRVAKDKNLTDIAGNAPQISLNALGELHPLGTVKAVEAIERVSRGQDLELEQRYKRLNQRLQIVSILVALLAIGLTYWNVQVQSSNVKLQALNNEFQMSQSEFEKNQRVTELAVSLGSYWEERLDRETRYRLARFIAVLKSLKPEDQQQFLKSFMDDKYIYDASLIKNNKALSELVNPAYSPHGPETSPSFELSMYRSDLVKTLNTMEMIAICRQHSNYPEAQRVLENAYVSSIKMRYKHLLPFIKAYREKYHDDRKVPAWQPLDALGNEPDN